MYFVFHDNQNTRFDSLDAAFNFYREYCQAFGVIHKATDGKFKLLAGHLPRPTGQLDNLNAQLRAA